MDNITLATTALTLITPFLNKIGEGTARKVGEDIWNLLKSPFQTKNKIIEEMGINDIKTILIEILNEDINFKNELESFVLNSQTNIENIHQTITNNGSIEKQVNVGNITGNVSL